MRWPLVAVSLLVSCDAGSPSSTGARLQPITYRADGVPALPAGWQDTELDVECVVRTATDGVQRCLPDRTAEFFNAFADDACARELYLGPPEHCAEPPPRFGDGFDVSISRSGMTEIVELEPADTTLPRAYHVLHDADGRRLCQPSSELIVASLRAKLAGHSLWQRKRAVDPELFVRVVGAERSQGIPTQVYDVMEDGARIPREVIDANGARCNMAAYEEGGLCLAESGHWGGDFADAACGTKAYLQLSWSSEAAPARQLIVDTSSTCASALGHVRVYGAEARQGETFFGSPASCVQNQQSAGYLVHGPEIELATLTRVALRRKGSGRLEALVFVDDRGDTLGVAQLWDRELSMVCQPARAADGSYRCLPRAHGGEHFADAACSQLRMGVGCAEPATGLLVTLLGADCGQARAGRLGERMADGPRFAHTRDLAGQSLACQPYSALLGPRGDVDVPSFVAGEELAPTSFARIERNVP